MRNLFEKVTDIDWMNNDESKIQDNAENMEQKIDNSSSSETEKEILKTLIALMKKERTEKEDYKAEVKEYSNYLIGRKMPENTPNFTDK